MTSPLLCQVNILPLGNSITDGDGEHNSYRRHLWHMLDTSGFDVDFIGSKHFNGYYDQVPPDPDFDMDHEGHSGWTSHDLLFGPDGWDQNRGTLSEWLQQYTPDIVLMHIGTNDIFGCSSADSVLKNISDIIGELRKDNPRVIILLAQIIPLAGPQQLGFDDKYCDPSKTLNKLVTELNSMISSNINTFTTEESPVYLVDQNTGFNPVKDLYDGIHPNENGEMKMAKAWYDKLVEAIPLVQKLARNHYVHPKGSDLGPGTLSRPWKTIARVNQANLYPGDSILFYGNSIYKGNISLKTNTVRDIRDIVVSSYGTGQAVINAGENSGLWLEGCSNISITNLKITGTGRLSGNSSDGLVVRDCHDIDIDDLKISGFQHSGLLVCGHSTDITITRVFAHDNGFAGIHVFGSYPDKNSCRHIYIGNCVAENNPGDPTVLDNHSGNGILVGVCDSVIIEYCEAFNNGWDMPRKGNGPVGIWAWHADHVIIQHCISHHNKTAPDASDGGGFDLDGGMTNSVIQYCLSYENEGAGFGIFEYQGAEVWENNTIRYSISINDGTNFGGVGAAVWNGNHDNQTLRNLYFYNNVLYNDLPQGKAVSYWEPYCSNLVFANNIFLTSGPALSEPYNAASYIGNVYWNFGKPFKLGGESSFTAWARKYDQEILGDTVVGMNADPMLFNPSPVDITDPADISFHTLAGFQLLPGSLLRDRGLDLKKVFKVDMGVTDFFGDTIPVNYQYDIGVHEYKNIAPVITSSPFTSVLAGQAYRYVLMATDPNAGDTISFKADSIPSWIAFAGSSGLLEGTPSASDTGACMVTLEVSDGFLSSRQTYDLFVKTANNAPLFLSVPDTLADEGSYYLYDIKVSDKDTVDALIVMMEKKPAWLKFDLLSRQLAGRPVREDAGMDTVIIFTTDGMDTVKQFFVLSVRKVNNPPVITSVPAVRAYAGVIYNYTIQVSDPDVSDTLRFITLTLPGWLGFDPVTGLLSGMPDTNDLGYCQVHLSVTDAMDTTDQSYIIQVVMPGAPVINDPGFEIYGIAGSWKTWTDGGTVTLETGIVHSGLNAARLTGYYTDLYQLIDVMPFSEYLLKAWICTGDEDGVWFGVKNYGGPEVGKYIRAAAYTEAAVPFTTGSDPSPAEIYIWKDKGTGSIYADDFSIQLVKTAVPAIPVIQDTPFVLYPNPATGNDVICFEIKDLKAGKDLSISISDISGKCFFKKNYRNMTSGILTLDLKETHLTPGYYQLSLIHKNRVETCNLVIH